MVQLSPSCPVYPGLHLQSATEVLLGGELDEAGHASHGQPKLICMVLAPQAPLQYSIRLEFSEISEEEPETFALNSVERVSLKYHKSPVSLAQRYLELSSFT